MKIFFLKFIFGAAFFCFVFFSCTEKKYLGVTKAREYSNQLLKELDSVIIAFETAKKADSAVEAGMNFFKKLDSLQQKMDNLPEKFPDMLEPEAATQMEKVLKEYEIQFQRRQERYQLAMSGLHQRFPRSAKLIEFRNFLDRDYKNHIKLLLP